MIQKVRNINEINEVIEDKIDEWHAGTSNQSLHEYIKMTWKEYANWTKDHSKIPNGWENR